MSSAPSHPNPPEVPAGYQIVTVLDCNYLLHESEMGCVKRIEAIATALTRLHGLEVSE